MKFRCKPTSMSFSRAILDARSESSMNTMPLVEERDPQRRQSRIRSVVSVSRPQSSAFTINPRIPGRPFRLPASFGASPGLIALRSDRTLIWMIVDYFKDCGISAFAVLDTLFGSFALRSLSLLFNRCNCSLRWNWTSSCGTGRSILRTAAQV